MLLQQPDPAGKPKTLSSLRLDFQGAWVPDPGATGREQARLSLLGGGGSPPLLRLVTLK